jgi:predicted dehydrogenase
MQRLTRRRFLQSSLAAAATVAIAGTKSSGKVLGANDTIRLAVAGLNGRGGEHVASFLKIKNVEIAYLIDPDTRTFGKRLKQIEDRGGKAPKTVQDVRQALEDKELHAVSVATPNHWHALMTVWACQAGKDVYVEKPCSHNVVEGAVAVQAARKYGRIVQHGTQSRSSARWGATAELVRSGPFGKLLVSRALCYKKRDSIGNKPTAVPPKELDFNLWLGPAAERPFHANLVHYNWHWFWDFGNGDIGNQGVHEMDIARWMIPGATLPRSVLSLGGRFGYSDQGETPNTQIALMDFGPTQLIFEVRGLKTGALRGQKIGNILHFESGVVAGGKFYPKGGKEAQPLPKVEVRGGPPRRGDHFANFIEAMRSRKTEDLCADIEEGYLSATLCHLANVSYRLGEPVPFNPRTKAFGDNKDAYEALARMEEHLAEGNGLKLDGLKYRLGRRLTVGDRGETLASDPQVRPLLTRNYRKPFEVPAKV